MAVFFTSFRTISWDVVVRLTSNLVHGTGILREKNIENFVNFAEPVRILHTGMRS